MKRPANNLSLGENTAPASKRARRTIEVSRSHEHASQSFHFAGKEHVLVARLQVKTDPEHACVKRIHAIFELRAIEEKKRPVKIGYLYGQTIDTKLTSHHSAAQPLFVSEMLDKRSAHDQVDRPMEHSTKKEIDETELIMQHMFHRNGTPREEYSSKILDRRAKLHFIAAFELAPAYRGCGLAKVAMHTYLRGIQNLAGSHKFRGTVFLSPAALPQTRTCFANRSHSRPIKTLVEIEHALIASYERAGFKVWTKGDDKLEGRAITIMGMRLTGPKIAKVRTEPLMPLLTTDGAEADIDYPSERVGSGL